MKILEPAWWSYVGDDIRRIITPLVPPLGFAVPYLAIIAGHALSRLPLRRTSFGQPLVPHSAAKNPVIA